MFSFLGKLQVKPFLGGVDNLGSDKQSILKLFMVNKFHQIYLT